MKKILIFLISFFYYSCALASENLIPSEIKADFSNPKILGSANLKVYGLNIYNIWLWTENDKNSKNYQDKFAIRIKYNRDFTKEELVDKSISEIKRIHQTDDLQNAQYQKDLNQLLIDVKKGDVKTAFFTTKNGLMMYKNGQKVGQIKNPILARYFTDIWLSENAEYKKVRNQLIGLNGN